MEKYYSRNNEEYIVRDKIGSGGEGDVFLLENNMILKVYKETAQIDRKSGKIQLFINKNLAYKGVCFPVESVFNVKGNFIGYVMEKAGGHELQKSVFLPKLLSKKFPNWTRIQLCELSLNILGKIQYLHDNMIIVGDINPNNILVKNTDEIYFVDTDSYQIDNYPCPVGTTHFTPPELQGENFTNLLRTKEHEYFAVSTLLFMIFLPGKAPYSFQGGGTLKENIVNSNFSYPLGDTDNYQAPKGMWEFIWYELSYDLRSAFYSTFKNNKRITIEQWINIIEQYKKDLENNKYPKEIIPSDTSKILQNKTLSMNRRDITEKDENLRIIKTELTKKPNESKFAVLELSTKAVKLLFCNDTNRIMKEGFSFNYFYREGNKTETGKGLDSQNVMDMSFFNSRVIPVISRMVDKAVRNGIEIIYTVATAAYRTANNRTEILQTIKSKCGVNVKILSKEEEAKATIFAFFFSKPKIFDAAFAKANYVLSIDQGGGSTEFSLFDTSDNSNQFSQVGSHSLNLGTTVLKTILFREATEHTRLDKAISDASKLIKDRLRTFYNSPKSSFLNSKKIDLVISVGTAITNATGKKGNKKQHGTILTFEHISRIIDSLDEKLNLKYYYVSDLHSDLENMQGSKGDALDNMIVMRIGLIMYIEIMKNFGLKQIIVSGTGLWYGIYFQQLYKIN